MRLELRQRLYPYRSLSELAKALGTTLPSLKRKLARLEQEGSLSLDSLANAYKVAIPTYDNDLFNSFHKNQLCLVCGGQMKKVEGNQAGWGEFTQCVFCGFSVHENADFARSKEIAIKQLDELKTAFKRSKRILTERKKRGAFLSQPPNP